MILKQVAVFNGVCRTSFYNDVEHVAIHEPASEAPKEDFDSYVEVYTVKSGEIKLPFKGTFFLLNDNGKTIDRF